jgi:hypothetical protein
MRPNWDRRASAPQFSSLFYDGTQFAPFQARLETVFAMRRLTFQIEQTATLNGGRAKAEPKAQPRDFNARPNMLRAQVFQKYSGSNLPARGVFEDFGVAAR